jgi:hypothetical protein
MNILYLTYSRPYNDKFSKIGHQHYVSELKSKGYTVDVIYFDDFGSKQLFNKYIDIIDKTKYLYFFTDLNDNNFHISTLKKFTFGIKSILLCPDNMMVPFNHLAISKYFSIVWLFDDCNYRLFKLFRANYKHLPWASKSFVFEKNFDEKQYINRVAFVGSLNPSRIIAINKLLASGIPVDVYGDNNTSSSIHKSYKHFLKGFFKSPLRTVLNLFFNYYGLLVLFSRLYSYKKNNSLNSSSPFLNILPFTDDFPGIYYKYKLSLVVENLKSTAIYKNPIKITNLRPFEIISSGGIILVENPNVISKYLGKTFNYISYSENLNEVRDFLSNISSENLYRQKKKNIEMSNKFHNWESRFREIEKDLFKK